ncbi:hypothetical protein ACFV16_22120 [Streptomyces massasporeus]|uniref:hypothetical protein n=1 Tax=Streptomyces massasporeus TaxID=67324 RepID=UPI00369E0788
MSTVDPAVALRRIEKLERDRRRVLRSRGRCTPGSDYARDLDAQLVDLDDEIERWGELVSRAEQEGRFRVWSRTDFRPGDFVRYRDTWYEVLKVNAKSLTIPLAGAGLDVVRRQDAHKGFTWTARYTDGVTDRMSPEEMKDHQSGSGSSGAGARK